LYHMIVFKDSPTKEEKAVEEESALPY